MYCLLNLSLIVFCDLGLVPEILDELWVFSIHSKFKVTLDHSSLTSALLEKVLSSPMTSLAWWLLP